MAEAKPLVIRCLRAPFLHFTMENGECILGRSARCRFVVDDVSVSRRHAELRAAAAGLQVNDLGSRNGTFVSNVRVEPGWVTATVGQVVRFGNVAFEVGVLEPTSEEDTDMPHGGNADAQSMWQRCAETLTEGQSRVLKPLLEGLPEAAVAEQLFLSRHTVHNHARAIFRAFGVHSRAQLLALYNRSSRP